MTDNVFPKEMLALQSVFLSPAEKSEHGEEMALRRFTSALVSLTWQLQRDVRPVPQLSGS